jgi:hypothetical protein
MQTDDIGRGSKYKGVKKVSYWVVGTVVAVPITKWVESQLNLSFFSPAIAGLLDFMRGVGDWLNHPVSIQLWMLLVLNVGVALIAGAGLWGISNRNKELRTVNAVLEGVNEKLIAAQSRITYLESPRLPEIQPLSLSQQLVLDFIAECEHRASHPFVREYPNYMDLSHLQVKGALDGLITRGLVKTIYAGTTLKALLTSAGREFVLSAEGD